MINKNKLKERCKVEKEMNGKTGKIEKKKEI